MRVNYRVRETLEFTAFLRVYRFSLSTLYFSSADVYFPISGETQIAAMFKQASRLLSRSVTAASSKSATSRSFSSEVPSTLDSTFIESWKKVAPNMDPPQTPSSFMKPRPSTPSTLPTKLTVNFVLPYTSELSGKEVWLFYLLRSFIPILNFQGLIYDFVHVDASGYWIVCGF